MPAHGLRNGIDLLQSMGAGSDFWLKKQIGVFQRCDEVFAAVAILVNVLMLNLGKGLQHIHSAKPEVSHPQKELLSHLLEIDIILPERVVGINQQCRGRQTIHETPADLPNTAE